MIHTMSARPTELAFSNTPFGLTKIPEPMMLPLKEKTERLSIRNGNYCRKQVIKREGFIVCEKRG